MIRAFLLAAALVSPASAEVAWLASLDAAKAAAAKDGKPILADFHAPWCYSCYYMEEKVLSKPAFADAARGFVLLKLDVDTPEGKAFKSARGVNFLPSYLLLDETGKELGRLVGEQTEEQFLAQLAELRRSSGRDPEGEAVMTLDGFLKRKEFDKATAFRKGVAKGLRANLEKRTDWAVLEARLDLRGDGWERAARTLIGRNEGCDFMYDGFEILKRKPKTDMLDALEVRLSAMVERDLGREPKKCADQRSGVEALADTLRAKGDEAGLKALLDRAVAALQADSAKVGLGVDRNLDDNLRYFLESAGRDAALEELYPKLVAAYPADYVYAYRYGKWLAGRKEWARALEWLEKADKLCYGANRLAVTKWRAQTLAGLGRSDEAKGLLDREIRAYAKAFPDETAPLVELRGKL